MDNRDLHHVVVVEDNIITNNLLRDWLKLNFQVVCFLDAESASRLLSSTEERWVFLIDYNLPGDNGIKLKQKLVGRFPNSKFILTSGLFDETLTRQAMEAGFDVIIPKPFSMPQLSKKIQDLLDLPSQKPNLIRLIKESGHISAPPTT